MILHPPFIIGARLLPALKIGDTYLNHCDGTFILDFADGTSYIIDDYTPGIFHDTQACFNDTLEFMLAAAESREYRLRTGQPGENEDLFPVHIVDWICENRDEIEALACDLEIDDLIEE